VTAGATEYWAGVAEHIGMAEAARYVNAAGNTAHIRMAGIARYAGQGA